MLKKFKNANLFIKDRGFVKGDFSILDGKFSNILDNDDSDGEIINLDGMTVIPGLIDIHGHGNTGNDFSTCDEAGLRKMSEYLGKNGITSFAPASMTMDYNDLERAYVNANNVFNNPVKGGSKVVGINMEGPFFSYGKRGAQNPAYLKNPDFEAFSKLNEISGGLIKLVDVAPELDGALDFINNASKICTVSVAHTECDYETAKEAFNNGATNLTHLFNGMPSLHHRNPGPICAGAENDNVYAELICDGIHIHPSVIRAAFKMFPHRIVLISDSLSCCGMTDGRYTLGEQEINLVGRKATLDDGTIAGSATNLFEMLKNVISFGIPAEEAVLSATYNPAKQLGLENEIGSIENGLSADFIILDNDFNLMGIYIDGISIDL